MAVSTLSMVGFRDEMGPGGTISRELKIFTIVVILFGVSTVIIILGGIFQMMTEGEINRALGLRRVTREIKRLSGHVIVCGFGRVGEMLADELRLRKQPLVVVDDDAERIADAISQDYLAIHADATEEEALVDAGVHSAKAVVTSLPSDADNLFITLTARNLNRDVQIIARGETRSTEKKLIQAGADRVVLPAAAGAMRMAAMVTRPSTIELVELVAGRHVAEVEIDELTIPPESSLVGLTVADSQTRRLHGLLIVALRHADGSLRFNPDADTVFQSGDTVIAMGRVDDIERFRTEHGI
jgi:voltage-gated potassium channel